jgi:hypothetical protein
MARSLGDAEAETVATAEAEVADDGSMSAGSSAGTGASVGLQ